MSHVIIKNNLKNLSHLLSFKPWNLHLLLEKTCSMLWVWWHLLTKLKSEFDNICYLSEKLCNSNSLIRFAAQATLFKTWLLTTFAASSKILCLIKFAHRRKFVQSLGLLTFASWANKFNTKTLVAFAMQSNLVQLRKFDHPW